LLESSVGGLMEESLKEAALSFFENVDSILTRMTPRNKADIDEVIVVYIDTVNGKPKHRTNYNLLEIWTALNEGSKPIGLILMNWNGNDIKMKEFPNITTEEQAILVHALAETQDQNAEEREL
jgi:hypothetical protein